MTCVASSTELKRMSAALEPLPPGKTLHWTTVPICAKMGTVVQCKVLPGGKGSSAALIRFSSVEEATQVIEAVESVQGYIEGCDQPINIRFADPPKWQQQGQKGGKGGAGGAQWPATQGSSAGGKGKG